MMPIDETRGLSPQARVIPLGRAAQVSVGQGLLGRVLDGLGRPLDDAGEPPGCERVEGRGSTD